MLFKLFPLVFNFFKLLSILDPCPGLLRTGVFDVKKQFSVVKKQFSVVKKQLINYLVCG